MSALPRRYDYSGELLRPVRRASDGVLLAEGVCVREGILEYPQADGTIRRELVTLDAVLDTARTLARASMTLEHPDEGFVTAENSGRLGIGDVDGQIVIGGVKRDAAGMLVSDYEEAQGGFATVRVALRRADAIGAYDQGSHRELSPGYGVQLDETPGEHPVHGRYDARQIGRECNHLALVPRGRGASVFLRADAGDLAGQATTAGTPRHEGHMIPKLVTMLTLLGVERHDAEDAALDAGIAAVKTLTTAATRRKDEGDEAATAALAAKDGEIAALKAAMEKMAGELAALKAAAEEAEKVAVAKADAAALASLQSLAGKVGVKADGLDLAALRVAVAKTRIDSVTAETPVAYLDGVIAGIGAGVTSGSANQDSRWSMTQAARADATAAYVDPYLAAADTAYGGAQ